MDLKSYWQNRLQKYSTEPWSKNPNPFASEVVKYLPKSGKILDLAAGLGQDSQYFVSLGYSVVSTDLVPPSQIVDLNNPLPFSKESFDVVYSHLGLQFFTIDRTKELFQEIYNILKSEGIFCVVLNSLTDEEISHSTRIGGDYYLTPSGLTKRFFSVDSLRKLLPPEFKVLLLDDYGRTIKDKNNHLIRLICQK